MQRFKKFQPEATQLFRPPCWSHIYGLREEFTITQPARLKTTGQLNLRHRGLSGYAGPIAYAVRVALRYKAPGAPPFAGEVHGSPPPFIYGALSSGNIGSLDDHYGEATLISDTILTQAGSYAVSVWGISASSALPSTDGLIEVNGDAGAFLQNPYTQFIIEVDDWPVAPCTQAMVNGQWP